MDVLSCRRLQSFHFSLLHNNALEQILHSVGKKARANKSGLTWLMILVFWDLLPNCSSCQLTAVPQRQCLPCLPVLVTRGVCVRYHQTGISHYSVWRELMKLDFLNFMTNADCAFGTLFFRARVNVFSQERHRRSSSSSPWPLGTLCQLPKLRISPSGFGHHVPRLRTSALSS